MAIPDTELHRYRNIFTFLKQAFKRNLSIEDMMNAYDGMKLIRTLGPEERLEGIKIAESKFPGFSEAYITLAGPAIEKMASSPDNDVTNINS
jgi:hypothetical protein